MNFLAERKGLGREGWTEREREREREGGRERGRERSSWFGECMCGGGRGRRN